MSALHRLIASLSRGVLFRSLMRLLPGGGYRAAFVALLALVSYFVASSASAQAVCVPPKIQKTQDCWKYSTVPSCSGSPAGACSAMTTVQDPFTYQFTFKEQIDSENAKCSGRSINNYTGVDSNIGDYSVSNTPITTCEDPPPKSCARGQQIAGKETLFRSSALTTFVCLDGCAGRGFAAGEYAEGLAYVWGPVVATGERCDGTGSGGLNPPATPASAAEPAPQPSKPGYCPGTVNGVAVSVPCGRTAAGSDSVQGPASPASGAASGPGTGAVSGDTGTTRKETICTADGSCTTRTTTTITTPEGVSKTTEKSDTENPKGFCEENPGLAICIDGSFGGNCQAGFQCKGDAVQCAIARQAHQDSCRVHGENEASAIGLAAMAASAPSASASSVTFDLAGRLSDVPLFGSNGGCPSDVSVSVLGSSVAIPFSTMCGSLNIIAVALKAFALLVAGFIVFRRA